MTLRLKLLLLLLAFGALAALSIGGFAYNRAVDDLNAAALAQLEAIATAKRDALRFVTGGWVAEAIQIASSTRLRTALHAHDRGDSSQTREVIRRILEDSGQSNDELLGIIVLAAGGEEVTRYMKAGTQPFYSQAKGLPVRSPASEKSGIPSLTRIYSGQNGGLMVEYQVPLMIDGIRIGTLILHRMANEISEITADYTGLGASGETVVAKRLGNGDALFITALRHDPHAAFRRTVRSERTDIPSVTAVQGRELAVYDRFVDYRDVPVLSVTRYVPEIDGGLVSKIDLAEANAPAMAVRNAILWGLLILLLVGALAAFFVSGRVVRPIKAIAETVGQISTGKFDSRVDVTGRDELGVLADGINDMARRLGASATDLAASEEKFRRAFDDAAIGMALVSLQGSWVVVNDALATMLGYTEAELLRTDFQSVTHPEDLDADLALVSDLLEGRIDKYTMDKRYIRRDSGVVHVRLNVSLIRDTAGNPLHFVSQIEDMTAEVEAREGLKDAISQLENSNRELEDFAYTASHDLKEPLRTITNFSRFLVEDYGDKLDEDGQRMIGLMSDSSERLELLIDELLRYSRVGRAVLRLEDVDLNDLLREVVTGLKSRLDDKGIALRSAEDMPVIRADRSQAKQIFENLIANSIQYSAENEPWIEVGWRHERPPRFFVRDNGIGIPEQHHEKVFRIFKRLHPRDEFGGGIGAGLTMVKKMVEKHGGNIWIAPDAESGTTVCFTLSGSVPNVTAPMVRV